MIQSTLDTADGNNAFMNMQDTLLSLDGADNAEFWLGICPGLSITERPFQNDLTLYEPPEKELSKYVRQFKKEGYTKTRPIVDPADIAKLRQGFENIIKTGLPPVFIFVYDEFWQIYKKLSSVLTPIFGENYNLTSNIWAWYIPPDDISSGFKPHRDFNNPNCVLPNGLPILGTVWIPLTNVTTLNSCMYVLPTDKDPCFPHDIADHHIAYAEIQGARALPAEPGSILTWHPLALHWGSHSSIFAEEPRISFATYISRDRGEISDCYRMSPELDLSLAYRLALIAQAVLHYKAEPFSYSLINSEALLDFSQAHIGCLAEFQKQSTGKTTK